MQVLALPPSSQPQAEGASEVGIGLEADRGDRRQGVVRLLPQGGVSSSVIDKRVSLEIRVMKEMMEELGGQLRWMSSERQVGDGLTKESARALLAARLRHRRIKLTCDPDYVASKKKTKSEKAKAIAETTQAGLPASRLDHENEATVDEQIPENVDVTEYPEIFADDDHPRYEETPVKVFCSQNVDPLTYVYAMSHGGWFRDTSFKGRFSNVLVMLLLASTLTVAKGQQCEKGVPSDTEDGSQLWLWLAILALLHVCIMTGVFMCGRWTVPLPGQKKKEAPLTKEAEIQKDEPVVHSRLRGLLDQEQQRSADALRSARDMNM